jgi:hypothetical protein
MKILTPAAGPEAWRPLLSDPEKHWRTGFSARTLAHCWHANAGLPREFASAFANAGFDELEPLIAIPEHKVKIPGRGFDSQMDLWVIARVARGLVGIGVEGKVGESFGPTIGEWNPEASENRRERLRGLRELLGVSTLSPDLRYQLVHRTGGTVAEAKRFGASIAVMVVHAFESPQSPYDDFVRFGNALGVDVKRNVLANVGIRSGAELWIGWIDGDRQFLEL